MTNSISGYVPALLQRLGQAVKESPRLTLLVKISALFSVAMLSMILVRHFKGSPKPNPPPSKPSNDNSSTEPSEPSNGNSSAQPAPRAKIQDFRPDIYDWARAACLERGIAHSSDDPLKINHEETKKFHKLFNVCYQELALFLKENNDDWDSEEGIAVADRFMRAGYASGMRCLENVIAYVDETPSVTKNEYWANNQDYLSKVTRAIPEQPDCFINTREMAMANQTLQFISFFSDLVKAYYITRGKGKVVDSIPIYSGKLDDTDRVEVGVRHLLSSNMTASKKGAAHFYEEGTKQCYWRQLYNSACDITADTLNMDLLKLCDRRITQALIKDLNMDFDVDMPDWAT